MLFGGPLRSNPPLMMRNNAKTTTGEAQPQPKHAPTGVNVALARCLLLTWWLHMWQARSYGIHNTQLLLLPWDLLHQSSMLRRMEFHRLTWFENYSKCHLWIFWFWHFPSIFVIFKVTCLVTLFDRKLQIFKNSPKWSIFGTFVHSKCKRSLLRSQCWMRLFLWFSNTVRM